MELHQITMDKAEAARRYREYRTALLVEHSSEMKQIAAGYKALAKGTPILALAATMKLAGVDSIHQPMLAIGRADWAWSWLEGWTDGSVRFTATRYVGGRDKKYELRAGVLPQRSQHIEGRRAMMPPIPPRFKPAGALDNYAILWEAEWKQEPPADPALLKHIGGDLYAVLATWDLTPLERAVLTGRPR
jgi:hypothetical protein